MCTTRLGANALCGSETRHGLGTRWLEGVYQLSHSCALDMDRLYRFDNEWQDVLKHKKEDLRVSSCGESRSPSNSASFGIRRRYSTFKCYLGLDDNKRRGIWCLTTVWNGDDKRLADPIRFATMVL